MVSKVRRRGAEDFGFGSSQRHAPSKVTFGIWVVTHSSAGERLGYMLLWKCTSRMIILYSRLNGVHPILYLVNMSHLICVCVCVCLSCVSPMRDPHEDTACDPVNADSILYVHVCARATWKQCMWVCTWKYIHYYPSHTSGFCVRVATITGSTSCFCVSRQTAANLRWQRGTEEISPWNIKQKLPWRRLLFIYIHLQPKAYQMWHVCCSFLNVCFSPTHRA